jgi:SH3-like domain-containing protein
MPPLRGAPHAHAPRARRRDRRPVAGLPQVLAVAALAAASVPTQAAEYRSLANAAVLYDGPSRQARKLFAGPRGMPLEVISTLGQWVKVRDVSGDVVWVERPELAERRAVVTTTLATVRQQPQDSAATVLHADRGVLLELVEGGEPSAGWLRVRHREGGTGWVRNGEVWGW